MSWARDLAMRYLPAPLLNRLVRYRAARRFPHVRAASTEGVFSEIKRANAWRTDESISGGGSTMAFTETVRNWLPRLFAELNVRTFVDIPCGDFAWMRELPMDGIRYIGGDIVRELVDENEAKYGSPTRKFVHLDLAKDDLPAGDLLLCKDCLIHLSHGLGLACLRNMRKAGYRHVLLTTYPKQTRNVDILTGDTWRVNLQLPPYNLPPPAQQVFEGEEAETEKWLGLWPLSALPS